MRASVWASWLSCLQGITRAGNSEAAVSPELCQFQFGRGNFIGQLACQLIAQTDESLDFAFQVGRCFTSEIIDDDCFFHGAEICLDGA